MDRYRLDAIGFDAFQQATQVLVFGVALENYINTQLGIPVWCCHLPQVATSYPGIVYKLNRRNSYYTLLSASTLVEVEYSLSVIGPVKADVDSLSEALRGCLEGFRGNLGGLTVTGCRKLTRAVQYTPSQWRDDSGQYEAPAVYKFFYERR